MKLMRDLAAITSEVLKGPCPSPLDTAQAVAAEGTPGPPRPSVPPPAVTEQNQKFTMGVNLC